MKPFYFFFLISSIVLLLSGSCKKGGPCEEPPNVNLSEVTVSFIDQQTGRYLYSETNPLYNKDSLKVFEEGGNQIFVLFALNQIPNSLNRYYVVGIGPIYNNQSDQNSFSGEKCKNFIIKYNSINTDTIKTCFKCKETKCGSVFETLKVFHKGALIGNNENRNHILITLYKN